MIDHLVYASNDLPSASTSVARLLGAAPTPGGRHIGHGTCNELLSLGGATYLEVIGPDPTQPALDSPRPFGIDGLTEPALVAWCVRPRRPLVDIVDEARAIGIELGDVTAMTRRRPDGVLLSWSLTFPQLDGPFGRALPFMIDWADSAHPTDSLPPAVTLVELDVAHPEPRALRAALDLIGITVKVTIHQRPQPGLRARIATQHGAVILTS
ncbi:MAG: VOC family protein [Ilumatobacteraceae bacterium]